MKGLLFIITVFFAFANVWAQAVTISESAGWLESAYIKWAPVSGADSYNVYYTGGGVTNHKIDDQLIRNYGSYCRADVVGIKAGSYTIKVAPVISGKEGTAAVTNSLTVQAYDRTGFAFAGGVVPGAYKADGTPRDGAVVVYLTAKNENTISMTVTGANANPCVGIQTILDAFAKGKDTRPLIVRVVGQVPVPTHSGYDGDGDILISNKQNASSYVTLEGIGDDATANGWGVRLKNASNVEVRNLGVMNVNSTAGDDIGLQQDNDHIWIHNNDHFYGDAGSDADQVKGDGAMDIKGSTYVTVAYDHFVDNGKSSLLGLSEGTTSGLYVTYHHNWFDHSDSRHPRVRFYTVHLYNNYYDGIAKYGVGSTMGSSIFVENNYFRHCKRPMMISMQGTDVWDDSAKANDYKNMPTFSKENGGIIKAFNNTIIDALRFVPYGATVFPNSTVDFDAYVASTRNEKVPSTVKSAYGSNTYNNFDTDNSVMYAYTADSPENVVTKVKTYAGRMNGGDFKWTFDSTVDDTASSVNTQLKAAVTNYKTKLVSIQGDGNNVGVQKSFKSSQFDLHSNPIHFDPNSNKLSLNNAYRVQFVKIFTPNGNLIQSKSIGMQGITLGDLSTGIYLVKITTDQGSFKKTIMKTH